MRDQDQIGSSLFLVIEYTIWNVLGKKPRHVSGYMATHGRFAMILSHFAACLCSDSHSVQASAACLIANAPSSMTRSVKALTLERKRNKVKHKSSENKRTKLLKCTAC